MKLEINTTELTQKEAIELVNKTYKEDNTICSCYHEEKVKVYYTDFVRGLYQCRGIEPPEYEIETRCSGTRGDEICDCNGDRNECTYYPKNKEELKCQ